MRASELNNLIAKNSKVQELVRQNAQRQLEAAKTQLMLEFSLHPVSREIQGGKNASNSSGTLGGYGNLFSFIGFESGDDPVKKWMNFIKNNIYIKKIQYKSGSKALQFEVKVNAINDEDLVSEAGMPWESGRSWITGIERGISGFSYYIMKSLGRSGGGVQAKNEIRPDTQYSMVSYWSDMWKNFLKQLNS